LTVLGLNHRQMNTLNEVCSFVYGLNISEK
jgi:hypothetical protein